MTEEVFKQGPYTYTYASTGNSVVVDMSDYYAQLDAIYGKDRVLYMYDRGPGDPPGNTWITRKQAIEMGLVEEND